MYVGKRIKNRRIELGLSADEVASALGKNRATIYRYESNDIENFPITVLEPLANVLQTTPAYLMGWTDDPNGFPPSSEIKNPVNSDIVIFDGKKMHDVSKLSNSSQSVINDVIDMIGGSAYALTHKIPILGRVAAGLPMYAEQNIDGYTLATLPHGGKYFALRVKGDSMTAARIFEGDLVVVREQEIVENGEIAVVLVNGDDATIKLFHADGNTITLFPNSFNPVHKPQIYDASKVEIRVIGKVVLNQIKFD